MIVQRVTTAALPAVFLLLAASPVAAQDVRAEVQIRTGPVIGRVIIGETDHHSTDRERAAVIERRDARRVTVVEDFRAKTQRSHARHDNRHVAAWWDPRSEAYGFQRWRSGLHRVLLCEHGSKFYVLSDPYLNRDPRWDRRDRD